MISLREFAKSLRHAAAGVKFAFLNEQNFRIELLVAVAVLLLAWLFAFDVFRWIVLLLMVFSVILMELLNTVFEKVVDILKPRLHPYARVVKDLMAGAVLLTAFMATVVGVMLFWGPVMRFFS